MFSLQLFLDRCQALRRSLSPIQDAMLQQRLSLLRRTVNDKAKSIRTAFKPGHLIILECVVGASLDSQMLRAVRTAFLTRSWMDRKPCVAACFTGEELPKLLNAHV